MNTSSTVLAPSGYAAMARWYMFGKTEMSRSLTVVFGGIVLSLAPFIAMVANSPRSGSALLVALCVLAGLGSVLGTSVAARALRLFSAARAPTTATLAWRLGWLQGQAVVGLGVGGLSFTLLGWRWGWWSDAWILPGAVVLSQALAAWFALSRLGYARSIWLGMAGTCPLIATLIVARSPGIANSGIDFAWLGVGLFVLGLGLLLAAWFRLTPDQYRAQPTDSMLVNFSLWKQLRRWTPLEPSASDSPGTLLFSVAMNFYFLNFIGMAVTSQWGADIDASKLSQFVLIVFLSQSMLHLTRVHWRYWLMPGQTYRPHLGRQLLVSTLQLYGAVGAVVCVGAAIVAMSAGISPSDVVAFASSRLVFVPEFVCAVSVAVLINGRTKGRKFTPASLSVFMLVAAFAMVALIDLAAPSFHLLPFMHGQSWGQVGTRYIIALILTTIGVTLWADRVWARRDIVDLMRRKERT